MPRFLTRKYREDFAGLTHKVVDSETRDTWTGAFMVVDEAMSAEDAQELADAMNSLDQRFLTRKDLKELEARYPMPDPKLLEPPYSGKTLGDVEIFLEPGQVLGAIKVMDAQGNTAGRAFLVPMQPGHGDRITLTFRLDEPI
jgi:hypothetical protein